MTDNPMNDYPWTPALRLRQVRVYGTANMSDGPKRVQCGLRLQQLWRHAGTQETEWRDVEVVDEEG